MVLLTYISPFITAIVLLLFFRKKTMWWEYVVVICPSLLLCLLIEFCMKEVNADDVEYLGYYVEKITYTEDWDEWIHKTCTRRVRIGTNSHGNPIYTTHSYDCSYREYHPKRWTYTLNNGHTEYFYNKEEFDKVLSKLKAEPKFIDMHRHYYTKDGDRYEYYWDKRCEHIYTMTQKHHYTNYIKSSHSLFKYEDITEENAKKLGLYDYPDIIEYDQNPVIGYPVDKSSVDAVKYINGFFGMRHQFRLFVLIYPNKDISVVDKQKSYWQGSNKNELVVCIGYNTKKQSIDWCESFSWADSPTLEVKTKDYFLTHNKLDIVGYCDYLKPMIKIYWHRKKFEDFKYINVELSDTQVTWLFIIILLYNIGISLWVIFNSFENDDNE